MSEASSEPTGDSSHPAAGSVSTVLAIGDLGQWERNANEVVLLEGSNRSNIYEIRPRPRSPAGAADRGAVIQF
jgi:hypothetical protein